MIDWYKEACSGPRTPPPSLQQLQAGSTCSGLTDRARQTLNLWDSAGNNIHHINFFHPQTVQRFLSPFPADARHDTIILALQRVEPEWLCCSAAAHDFSQRKSTTAIKEAEHLEDEDVLVVCREDLKFWSGFLCWFLVQERTTGVDPGIFGSTWRTPHSGTPPAFKPRPLLPRYNLICSFFRTSVGRRFKPIRFQL